MVMCEGEKTGELDIAGGDPGENHDACNTKKVGMGFMSQNTKKKVFNTQKLLAPAALVILYIFFSLFGKNFFSTYTAKTVLESAYFIGFMSFGVTFVIITGGIDLSIGTVMMCSAMVGGVAFSMWGWPLWLALALVAALRDLFSARSTGFW